MELRVSHNGKPSRRWKGEGDLLSEVRLHEAGNSVIVAGRRKNLLDEITAEHPGTSWLGMALTASSLIGMPLTFFMSNDAYYFGILPVIAETASQTAGPYAETYGAIAGVAVLLIWLHLSMLSQRGYSFNFSNDLMRMFKYAPAKVG